MKESSSDHLDSVSTLRKHYAGLAMQGIMGSDAFSRGEWEFHQIAKQALQMADALIAELSKK